MFILLFPTPAALCPDLSVEVPFWNEFPRRKFTARPVAPTKLPPPPPPRSEFIISLIIFNVAVQTNRGTPTRQIIRTQKQLSTQHTATMNYFRTTLILLASLGSSHAFSTSSSFTRRMSSPPTCQSSSPSCRSTALSMNLFDRFQRVAKANLNNVLQSLEDPEKIMTQALEDMQVCVFDQDLLLIM